MKKLLAAPLAALSAIVALTALPGLAAAGPRCEARPSGGERVFVEDDGDLDRRERRSHREAERRGDTADVMSERRIVRSLIAKGFVSVEEIRLRRDRYIVEAVRPNGALVRLAVDARDGEIIDRERIGWIGGGRPGPRGAIDFDIGGGSLGIHGR